jgi:hypothetical protein
MHCPQIARVRRRIAAQLRHVLREMPDATREDHNARANRWARLWRPFRRLLPKRADHGGVDWQA